LGFLDKIKTLFKGTAKEGQPLWEQTADTVQRELSYFKDAFRVGMLVYYTDLATHDLVMQYKKELDNLGFETEVLMFIDAKEVPRNIFLPTIKPSDLNKQGLPYTPRTDRFVKKKFDMLLNLYFNDCAPLKYLSATSIAKCRVGAMRDHLFEITDIFVYTSEEDDLQAFITSVNEVLKKQAYERKI
jgi:hypothetical protein